MTEAEKQDNQDQQNQESPKESMPQLSPKKAEEIKRILEEISRDREEIGPTQRFGYFSLLFPAIYGDQAYSQKKEYENHKVIDRKVIIEKRGIYTKPPKKGKGPDAYFEPIAPLTDEQVEMIKKMRQEDYEALMKKVQERKEKKAGNNFKPPGPQEMFSFYKEIFEPGGFAVPDLGSKAMEPGPLYIEPDKKRFIQDGHKVKTENRGIFTNPTKLGTSLCPSDYFHYYRSDDALNERLKEMAAKDIKDKLDLVQVRKENKAAARPTFKPASLKKCEPFSPNTEAYGLYNEDEKKQLMEEYKNFKKNGYPKYVKPFKKDWVKHDKPFAPARLVYQGRDGLFNDNLYTLPEPTEKDKQKVMSVREKRELEAAAAKNKRMPFTYNKLMRHSTFSPPITSFKTNLKREFPSIKFH